MGHEAYANLEVCFKKKRMQNGKNKARDRPEKVPCQGGADALGLCSLPVDLPDSRADLPV